MPYSTRNPPIPASAPHPHPRFPRRDSPKSPIALRKPSSFFPQVMFSASTSARSPTFPKSTTSSPPCCPALPWPSPSSSSPPPFSSPSAPSVRPVFLRLLRVLSAARRGFLSAVAELARLPGRQGVRWSPQAWAARRNPFRERLGNLAIGRNPVDDGLNEGVGLAVLAVYLVSVIARP